MTHSIFGWSYPPGCSGPPEWDGQCPVCGLEAGQCECPECELCETTGDPKCKINGGEGCGGLAELEKILTESFDKGTPYPSDVANHAVILVRNGWPAAKALEESRRTLDEAELEGGF